VHIPPSMKKLQHKSFHGAEIPYIFGNFPPNWQITQEDRRLHEEMSSYWVSFAKTGNPSGEKIIIWPPYDKNSDSYIEFSGNITIKNGLHKKNCDLFEKIYMARMKNRKQ